MSGKGGRPAMNGDGRTKRSPISMRVTAAMRARLDTSAASNGLSLAQEIERRLEASFEYADAAEYLGRHFTVLPVVSDETIRNIARTLSAAQRQCILAIRNGEKRRAIDFSGSVARNLSIERRSRPALLVEEPREGGRTMWYAHTEHGMRVAMHLRSTDDEAA